MNKIIINKNIIIFLICLLSPVASSIASEKMIFRAMQDELERSMQELEFDKFEKPYFLSYRIVDSRSYYSSASLGATLNESEQIKRVLVIDLRIGDYKLDNSNLFEIYFNRIPSLLDNRYQILIPIEADYTEIRRQLWLATDSAYKKAVQHYAKKKAIVSGKAVSERADDFLRVAPFVKVEKENIQKINLQDISALMRKLSKSSESYSKIHSSEVDLKFVSSYTRLINSEGTKVGRNDNVTRVLYRAETQTDDGEIIYDVDSVFSDTVSNLPNEKELKKMINNHLMEFNKRQKLPAVENYVGPVIFKPKAAAEVVRQTLAKQALAHRAPDKDPSVQIRGFSVNTLQGQLKQRILPRGFSLIDNPLEDKFDGQQLLGGFFADDQGVPSNKKILIKNGRLISLLSERSPIEEIEVVGGNHIDGSISASNLFLKSKSPISSKELEEELLALASEVEMDYGIVIERIGGAFNRLNDDKSVVIFGGSMGLTLDGLAAYKLYADGRKEYLRQVQIPKFDIRILKTIVAVGDDLTIYHAPSIRPGLSFFNRKGETEKYDVSSFVIPSILIEELSISAQDGGQNDLPISRAK